MCVRVRVCALVCDGVSVCVRVRVRAHVCDGVYVLVSMSIGVHVCVEVSVCDRESVNVSASARERKKEEEFERKTVVLQSFEASVSSFPSKLELSVSMMASLGAVQNLLPPAAAPGSLASAFSATGQHLPPRLLAPTQVNDST